MPVTNYFQPWIGIRHISEAEYDQQVLQRLGVPGKAIRVLEPPTTNTVDEEQHIAAELRRVCNAPNMDIGPSRPVMTAIFLFRPVRCSAPGALGSGENEGRRPFGDGMLGGYGGWES